MVAGPDDDADDLSEEPKGRTGRFHVQHRGGTRVEVGEPIHVGGDLPWMCAVKLVGQKRDVPEDPEEGVEPTQTLLVRTGRGATAEDARREALAQLTLVYGSPVAPPPAAVILQKPSDPPPPMEPQPETVRTHPRNPEKGFWGRLLDRLKGG